MGPKQWEESGVRVLGFQGQDGCGTSDCCDERRMAGIEGYSGELGEPEEWGKSIL